jgi:RNA polymerase nonessential primary-like sigma factor
MKSLDSVGTFLKNMGEIPLLTHEEEIEAAQKYQRYREIRNVEAHEQVNSTLARYNHAIAIRNCQSDKLSIAKWASLLGISSRELKEIISDGRTQLSIIQGIPVDKLIEIETEGIKSRSLLIKSNIRLVVSIAKKYLNRGLELLDLIQEGVLGMTQGIEKFNPTKGYRLSTYVYWWIRQSITRAITEKGRTIRLPQHIIETIGKVKKTTRVLTAKGAKKVTVEVVAAVLDISEDRIKNAILSDSTVLSTDVQLGKNQDFAWIDIFPSREPTPGELTERGMIYDLIPVLLKTLEGQELQIISLKYGLTGATPIGLVKIGKILNISRESVRKIEKKAMKKLKSVATQYQDIRDVLV